MSLDIYLMDRVHSQNITHNLASMASAAGIYELLWHPEADTLAEDLIKPLERAIDDMKARYDYYKNFDAENAWGTYEDFLPWLIQLLRACREHPYTSVKVST